MTFGGWPALALDFYSGLEADNSKSYWTSRKADYEDKLSHMVDVTRRYHDQQSYISYGTNMLPSWLVGGGEW